MKILMIGNFSGWMGLHLNHFISGFRSRGHIVYPADYNKMSRFGGIFPLNDKLSCELRQRGLEKLITSLRPDMVMMVSSCKFDLERLRGYYSGIISFYDYDGPRRNKMEDYLRFKTVDMFLTVSEYTRRNLTELGINAHYLAHGVDTGYYAPAELSPTEKKKFGSAFSYVGRATDRRSEYCREIANLGLALYGKRWRSNSKCIAAGLDSCNRLKRDVVGRELVMIYSASDAVLNILQEPLDQFQTILSLQNFAIPSAGACILTEYVEELPGAFVLGEEVLAFRSKEELREQAARCVREPGLVRKIGAAARKRCLAEHTHEKRVDAIMELIG